MADRPATILAFSPTEVVGKVNELIATGQYGRLFAVVHFASQQWKVTSEDLILINNKLDIACGERIRLEKVRASTSQGAVTKCALLPPGSSSGGFLGSAGEGEQSQRQEPGVPPGCRRPAEQGEVRVAGPNPGSPGFPSVQENMCAEVPRLGNVLPEKRMSLPGTGRGFAAAWPWRVSRRERCAGVRWTAANPGASGWHWWALLAIPRPWSASLAFPPTT